MAYCLKCGSELPENAFFCPNCGTKIEEKPSAKRARLKIAIIAVIVVISGLSFFVMPITSVSIISENIEMSENLVIEASGFYLFPLPKAFNCAEVYYTISWWDENEGE